MKKALPVIVFIGLQLASLAIMTLWIVWSAFSRSNVLWLLQGIFLSASVIGGATIIFVYLTKLRALDSERQAFISSVTHELLTPLSSLRLYLDTMLLRELEPATRKEFLERMVVDTDRLHALITRILLASKLEQQKLWYVFEENDLALSISEFLRGNPNLLKGAQLAIELEPNCLCRIDKEAFDSILKNLLQNAVRYSPEPAEISIRLQNIGDKLLLAIGDRGEGMSEKDQKKVFRMFYRASKKPGGTGLGLFIVKSVVAAHKGKVWAESGGQGQGATFKILLPVARPNHKTRGGQKDHG